MQHTGKAILAAAAFGLMAISITPADAKGCLKGAAVGGLAGHVAGHGVLGAAGGCAVGHHMANKKTAQQEFCNRQFEPAVVFDQRYRHPALIGRTSQDVRFVRTWGTLSAAMALTEHAAFLGDLANEKPFACLVYCRLRSCGSNQQS